MELNDKVNKLNNNESNSLREIQEAYSHFDFKKEGDITRLTDCSNITDLALDRILDTESSLNTILSDLKTHSNDLIKFFNLSVVSLDNLINEAKKLDKNISDSINEGRYKVLYKEIFRSNEKIDLINSNVHLDLGLGSCSSGISQAENILFEPLLGEKTSNDSIFGCNALGSNFSIDKTSGAVQVEKEANQSFCILNLQDGDPTSSFECESYFIKEKQPIKKSVSNYYLEGGALTSIKELIPDDDNVITIKVGDSVVERPLFKFKSEFPNQKLYLHIKLRFLEGNKKLNSLKLIPGFRVGSSSFVLESLRVSQKGSWKTVIQPRLIKNTEVISLDEDIECDAVDLTFSSEYYSTNLIYREFDTTKFLRKSTRSHGLWRTVDKWEAWERSPVSYSSKNIDIYSPSLLSSSGESYVPTSLFKGSSDVRILDPISSLTAYYNYKDATKGVDKLTGIVKALGNVKGTAQALDTLFGLNKNKSSAAIVSKLVPAGISSALGVYSNILSAYDIAKKAFSYNHQKTPENTLRAYDVFSGWRASISIKDIELRYHTYIPSSTITSKAIQISRRSSLIGLYVDYTEKEGVTYNLWLSKNGSTWEKVDNIKNNNKALIAVENSEYIYYKVDINSAKGVEGEISGISVVERL